ncbi:hypothetical protein [Arthrobacter psychrochitiniphilus]|uniref:hypothetical protein n=1 Tax=Arthrobacter psychrochitiniphilus TaxID=291045 RepID=UPI0011B59F9A|nr:hypothetical protein [Arthrobacter psychrochitiniphilus]
MRSRITFFAILLFTLLPVAPAIATTPPLVGDDAQTEKVPESGIGLRLLDVPAATQKDPRARSYIVDHLTPGATIKRRLQIANGTDEAHNIQLYPSAASIEDNAFSAAAGNTPNVLTEWTSVSQPALELQPGASVEVLVTVNVPADAPEGENYAVVWAEAHPSSQTGQGIVNASRVGIRMYLSVGPGNGPPADFSVNSMTPSRDLDGIPNLTALVTNTGGRALDISGSLMLEKGPAGLSAGPFPLDKGVTIAPGESAPVRTSLSLEIPSGPWQATFTVKSGLITHESTATIVFPDAGQGPAVKADNSGDTVILIAAFSIGAVLVLLIAFLWWRHRRKARLMQLS